MGQVRDMEAVVTLKEARSHRLAALQLPDQLLSAQLALLQPFLDLLQVDQPRSAGVLLRAAAQSLHPPHLSAAAGDGAPPPPQHVAPQLHAQRPVGAAAAPPEQLRVALPGGDEMSVRAELQERPDPVRSLGGGCAAPSSGASRAAHRGLHVDPPGPRAEDPRGKHHFPVLCDAN